MANSQIKYTYDGVTETKDDGYSLPTKGKLMADNLKGEVVLALEEKTVTTNGEVTPSNGKDGLSKVVVNVSTTAGVTWQEKTVTPSETAQTITPTGGTTPSYGLSKVTVNAITATYVGSQVPRQTSTSTPTWSHSATGDDVDVTVTVPAGYYADATQFTYEAKNILPATDPDATVSQILDGFQAYDEEGNLIEGTMPNHSNGAVNIPAGDADGEVLIPEGYYNGSGNAVAAAGTVKGNDVTATLSGPTFATNKFTVTASGSTSVSAVTAGWISGTVGTKQTGSISGSLDLAQVGVGVNASTTTLALNPSITRTAKPSADTWTDGANGAGVTTKPTSGVYVQVNRASVSSSATATGKVSTAGYGDATHFTPDTATTINASVTSATLYVPIKATTIGSPSATSTKSGPTTVTGTASTVTVPSGATIVRYTFTATPSYTQSAQGYVTDTAAHTGEATTQTVDIPVFQLS